MPFALSAVRTARLNLTAALRHAGVDQRILDDACVVVSELLSNALRHASSRPDGGLTVELEVSPADVTISVLDGGSATLPALMSAPTLAPSGRGLAIVRTLTEAWGVRESPAGNVVFGVLSREPDQGGLSPA